MGFSDLFQEGNGKPLQLLQVAVHFFCHRCSVQALANCRDFDVDSVATGLSFQLLTIGALIAI
jgi:hypothetical protein